jgi:hypothetical protein
MAASKDELGAALEQRFKGDIAAAVMLAEIIGRGEIAIDDPLAKLLPPGTSVPSFNGVYITVGQYPRTYLGPAVIFVAHYRLG